MDSKAMSLVLVSLCVLSAFVIPGFAKAASPNQKIIASYSVGMSMPSPGNDTKPCETCPMQVTPEEMTHFKVTDGNGTVHNIDCFTCAMKLISKYAQLHIESYCDCYGPDYKITVDVKQNGKVVTVNPQTAIYLTGGGCTGNRVAYNQTAADTLISKGYTKYTILMQQQALPAKTNATSISAAAMTYLLASTTAQNPQVSLLLPVVAVVSLAIVAVVLIAYKKLFK